MSGEIIELRDHQKLREVRRSRERVTQRAPARSARLEQQVTRILNLVQDLEDMTRSAARALAALGAIAGAVRDTPGER